MEQLISKMHQKIRKRKREKEFMGKEDFLLQQIDEFREKAKQLQGLLSTKENKVQELQSIVDEREGKAQELELILEERQEKADQMTDAVSAQIRDMMGSVNKKIEEIAEVLGERTDASQKSIEDSLSGLKPVIDELKPQLEETITPAVRDIDMAVQDLGKTVLEVDGKLGEMHTDLMEKIHSENVKCFRNIQAIVTELSEKVDTINVGEEHFNGIKSRLSFSLVLSIVNIVLIVIVYLHITGVFSIF